MLLIEIMLRIPLDDCYDWINFRINEYAILDKLNKLKGNFSNDLINFIAEILKIDENIRMDFMILG